MLIGYHFFFTVFTETLRTPHRHSSTHIPWDAGPILTTPYLFPRTAVLPSSAVVRHVSESSSGRSLAHTTLSEVVAHVDTGCGKLTGIKSILFILILYAEDLVSKASTEGIPVATATREYQRLTRDLARSLTRLCPLGKSYTTPCSFSLPSLSCHTGA